MLGAVRIHGHDDTVLPAITLCIGNDGSGTVYIFVTVISGYHVLDGRFFTASGALLGYLEHDFGWA